MVVGGGARGAWGPWARGGWRGVGWRRGASTGCGGELVSTRGGAASRQDEWTGVSLAAVTVRGGLEGLAGRVSRGNDLAIRQLDHGRSRLETARDHLLQAVTGGFRRLPAVTGDYRRITAGVISESAHNHL